jgi:hypothetical protein
VSVTQAAPAPYAIPPGFPMPGTTSVRPTRLRLTVAEMNYRPGGWPTCRHSGYPTTAPLNLPTRKRAARNLTPRPVNDTWIAARCLAHEVPLATLNSKDYEDVTEHRGFRLLGSP